MSSDAELLALTALVNLHAALVNADVAKYGECRTDPRCDAAIVLGAALRARGVLPTEKATERDSLEGPPPW